MSEFHRKVALADSTVVYIPNSFQGNSDYPSITVIKHGDQGSLQKKEFI